MRRIVVNALGVGAALVAIAGGVAAANVGSDVRAAHQVTAPTRPAALQPVQLPATASVRWAEQSSPPGEISADDTTVVVASEHGLSGRDPETARERWSYRRDNATLCAWTVRDHVVVAAFQKQHGCRELIGLDSGTGVRKWDRAVDLSAPVELTSAEGVAVFRSGDRLQAIDTGGGLNRWTSWQPGCVWGPLRISNLAAVAPLTCGSSTKIVAHDAYQELERWRVDAPGADPAVVSVGDPTAVLSTAGGKPQLTGYDDKGNLRWMVSDPRFTPQGARTGYAVDGQVVLWTGSSVVVVDPQTRSVRWQDPALGPPLLDAEGLLVSEPEGVVLRQVGTGRPIRRTALDRQPDATDIALAHTGALLVLTGRTGVTVLG